ncbi:MAG: AAA family ATPase, partial [Leptolyngbya sp. SIO1D8]|nr:AAA family ATPase [Leptolyngbya sp. SIO1D8]
ATAAKSNSVMAFFDALSTVEKEQQEDVPLSLRDANRDKHGFGHGQGYLYPHAYRDHWIAQQYLPRGLQGQMFYQPSDQGYEAQIQHQVVQQREAQLAALVETGEGLPEALTFSPEDPKLNRWLQRTLGQAGDRLAQIRDRLFTALQPQRHHIILDLNARSGLLTWEAVRQVPEGGVYARVETNQDLAALTEQAALLPELSRPVIFQATLATLPTALLKAAPDIQFDGIVGRNLFGAITPTSAWAASLVNDLAPTGRIALAETIPRETQRLWALVPAEQLAADLRDRWRQAENALYTDAADPRFSWDGETLAKLLETAGLQVDWTQETVQSDLFVSQALCDRWFAPTTAHSYRQRLAATLSEPDLKAIEKQLRRTVQNQTVTWQTTQVMLTARYA